MRRARSRSTRRAFYIRRGVRSRLPSGDGCLISDDESVNFDKDNDSDVASSVSSLDETIGDDLSDADVSVTVFACDKTDYYESDNSSNISSHASTSLGD